MNECTITITVPTSLRRSFQVELERLKSELSSDFPSYNQAKNSMARVYLITLLSHTRGNMSLASKMAKMGRPYFYKKIKEFGLDPKVFRAHKVKTELEYDDVNVGTISVKRKQHKNEPDKKPEEVFSTARRQDNVNRLKQLLKEGKISSDGLPMQPD